MKAIRYNVRKELIDVWGPMLPHMKEKGRKKILKEIEKLAPNKKQEKRSNIKALEQKRYQRLKEQGYFGTSR